MPIDTYLQYQARKTGVSAAQPEQTQDELATTIRAHIDASRLGIGVEESDMLPELLYQFHPRPRRVK